jgi:hypothetical protein
MLSVLSMMHAVMMWAYVRRRDKIAHIRFQSLCRSNLAQWKQPRSVVFTLISSGVSQSRLGTLVIV